MRVRALRGALFPGQHYYLVNAEKQDNNKEL